MGLITKIMENIFKIAAENSKVEHFVIRSWVDYGNHDLNVMRDCLSCWSSSEYAVKQNPDFHFSWMYSDEGKKIFFIALSHKQIKIYHLEYLLQCDDILASNYINSTMESLVFPTKDEVLSSHNLKSLYSA